MNISRRSLLRVTATATGVTLLGSVESALASVEEVEELISDFSAGAVVEEGGPLTLTTPEIAENGHSVSVSISVVSPMTADDYIESVSIMASDNPNPEVATFHFTPASGIAEVSTRMRLARTQDVYATARTNTGKVFQVSNNVKVTIGGCGV